MLLPKLSKLARSVLYNPGIGYNPGAGLPSLLSSMHWLPLLPPPTKPQTRKNYLAAYSIGSNNRANQVFRFVYQSSYYALQVDTSSDMFTRCMQPHAHSWLHALQFQSNLLIFVICHWQRNVFVLQCLALYHIVRCADRLRQHCAKSYFAQYAKPLSPINKRKRFRTPIKKCSRWRKLVVLYILQPCGP